MFCLLQTAVQLITAFLLYIEIFCFCVNIVYLTCPLSYVEVIEYKCKFAKLFLYHCRIKGPTTITTIRLVQAVKRIFSPCLVLNENMTVKDQLMQATKVYLTMPCDAAHCQVLFIEYGSSLGQCENMVTVMMWYYATFAEEYYYISYIKAWDDIQ